MEKIIRNINFLEVIIGDYVLEDYVAYIIGAIAIVIVGFVMFIGFQYEKKQEIAKVKKRAMKKKESEQLLNEMKEEDKTLDDKASKIEETKKDIVKPASTIQQASNQMNKMPNENIADDKKKAEDSTEINNKNKVEQINKVEATIQSNNFVEKAKTPTPDTMEKEELIKRINKDQISAIEVNSPLLKPIVLPKPGLDETRVLNDSLTKKNGSFFSDGFENKNPSQINNQNAKIKQQTNNINLNDQTAGFMPQTSNQTLEVKQQGNNRNTNNQTAGFMPQTANQNPGVKQQENNRNINNQTAGFMPQTANQNPGVKQQGNNRKINNQTTGFMPQTANQNTTIKQEINNTNTAVNKDKYVESNHQTAGFMTKGKDIKENLEMTSKVEMPELSKSEKYNNRFAVNKDKYVESNVEIITDRSRYEEHSNLYGNIGQKQELPKNDLNVIEKEVSPININVLKDSKEVDELEFTKTQLSKINNSIDNIAKAIEEDIKNDNIKLTAFEQEQEDNAIISYDDLVKTQSFKKSNISKTYEEKVEKLEELNQLSKEAKEDMKFLEELRKLRENI